MTTTTSGQPIPSDTPYGAPVIVRHTRFNGQRAVTAERTGRYAGQSDQKNAFYIDDADGHRKIADRLNMRVDHA